MKKAVIIIPTYNERENIQKVIPILLDVFSTIADWKMEILVVDDTSPDKTYLVVQELTKKHKAVHLLLNAKKSGLGGAYLKGMDYAFNKLGADAIFEFDADLSHDPKKIPLFLKELDRGIDLVLGSRYIPGGGIPKNWGLHRKFLSVVGNIVIAAVLTNFKIRDWTTGYRAVTRRVYDAVLPEMQSERFSGYTFQIGFLQTAVKHGFSVSEVPFQFTDRTIGKSKLGPEYIKNTLIYIFKVRAKELLTSTIFKFAVVGGMGAMVQLTTLQVWRLFVPFQLAFFLAIESAIISNFILNNFWTFSERRLDLRQMPLKFLQFNLASGGSIIIQQLVALVGEFSFGLVPIFTIPLLGYPFDTGTLYAIIGILIGMTWNFFAYTRFIWKKPAPVAPAK
jgi:dolichol-phosphate mannosyltransferase